MHPHDGRFLAPVPMYASYATLFEEALELPVLMERTARQNIAARDRGLDQFLLNRNDVRNPNSSLFADDFYEKAFYEGSLY